MQVESHPNSQVMMNVAKNLRVERDREKRVAAQKQEQMTNVCCACLTLFIIAVLHLHEEHSVCND